jgi:phage-related tail fiber protein
LTRLSAAATAILALALSISLSGCAASSSPGQRVSQAATATSGPAAQAQLTILVGQASGHLLGNIQAVYQLAGEKASITGTVSSAVPRTPSQISSAQEKVKTLCFQIQRALWNSRIALQEVTVTILGPVFDDYFDQIISWYGTASLEASSAAQIDWRGLGVDAAWNRFQRTQLRVDYGSFQLYGTTPVPTTASSPGGP